MAKQIALPSLEAKILSRQATIGIVGLGYVGLPLAIEFARAGFSVKGSDVNRERIDHINEGKSFITGIDDHELSKFAAAGQITAAQSLSGDIDVFIICVPTPLTPTREPDLSYVKAAGQALVPHLRAGQLVILESTSYPGTTQEVLAPILDQSGLAAGRDYHLGYSPERVDPGNPKFQIKNTPKIVSGLTPRCRELVELVYSQIVDEAVAVSSMKVAEMAKLLENIFRTVNIALVNELALLCDRLGISIWEVVDAASTKPFGFMRFLPGPGLGGHCLPVDPFYLSWKAKEVGFYTEFIELAGKTNEAMPHHVVHLAIDALNTKSKSINGARVLLMGVAYKKDVGDVRESPVFKLLPLLLERGAIVGYHDPLVSEVVIDHEVYRSQPLTGKLLNNTDCAIILTEHSTIDYAEIVDKVGLIVDTRNVYKGKYPEKVSLL